MGQQIAINPPRDHCMCPLGRAGRDVCDRACGCRSIGGWATRRARGARRITPARTSWTARARHCLGCRQPHRLGWNIRPRRANHAARLIFIESSAAAATRIARGSCACFVHIAPTQDGGDIFLIQTTTVHITSQPQTDTFWHSKNITCPHL